jgi:hypothetical protein
MAWVDDEPSLALSFGTLANWLTYPIVFPAGPHSFSHVYRNSDGTFMGWFRT